MLDVPHSFLKLHPCIRITISDANLFKGKFEEAQQINISLSSTPAAESESTEKKSPQPTSDVEAKDESKDKVEESAPTVQSDATADAVTQEAKDAAPAADESKSSEPATDA